MKMIMDVIKNVFLSKEHVRSERHLSSRSLGARTTRVSSRSTLSLPPISNPCLKARLTSEAFANG